MMDRKEKPHIVDVLFVLALFGVFTLSALVLVILGANIYKQTVSHMTQNYDSRMACSYFTEKIHQSDLASSVELGELYGTEALVFSQDIKGETYATYLYYHDGYLKELFMKKDSNIGTDPLDAGHSIMKLEHLDMEFISDNLLKIYFTLSPGQEQHVYISTHCNEYNQ
ncbi:MAG: DUF4860 domain-containing protein [Lachnospiraceae bacterium]|nr:DUF4860 domain-containing protein [Lachnospiraceae bacterium]